ncbi:MAG: MFS transporter, partial [Gammaproteobacteria bacterium]
QAKAQNKTPLLTILKKQKRNVFSIFLLLVMSAAGSYVLMGYLSTYMHVYLHYTMARALQLQALFNIISLFAVTFFSIVSDIYGRRLTLYIAVVGYIIFAFPCFYYLQFTGLWICLLPLVMAYSAEQSTTPVAMVEMFPGATRYSGVSIGYNFAMAIIGGTAPFINTWLIDTFNNTMMIAYYLIACAIISLLVIIFKLPRVFGHELELA